MGADVVDGVGLAAFADVYLDNKGVDAGEGLRFRV